MISILFRANQMGLCMLNIVEEIFIHDDTSDDFFDV